MSKDKVSQNFRPFGAALLIFAVTFSYQNCAPQKLDQASVYEVNTEESLHRDRDHHVDEDKREKVSTTFEPLIADRLYVVSLLNDIFGAAAISGEVLADIQENRTDFGSPCSIYENYRRPNGRGGLTTAIPGFTCSLRAPASSFGSRLTPNATVSRQALLAKTCANLLSNDTRLRNALAKISSEAVPTPNAANLQRAVMLFYRDKPVPPQSLIESLQITFDPAQPTLDDWRSTLYIVCASSHWQVM
ncbi:MAG TPA: hypothetical protein PLZ57_07045 [Pseudobdellovibrionaceae bacterium]|nr:hypothetical protein [Pseudobdellovibrionaceae bacterium]